MADYSARRPNRYDDGYEPSDEVSRPRDHASDPLAELARLIGKSEQFSNSARTDSRSHRQPVYRDPEPDDWGGESSARRAEPTRDYDSYEDDLPAAAPEPRLDSWRAEHRDVDRADHSDAGRHDYEPELEHDEHALDREHDVEEHYALEARAGEQDHFDPEEDQIYDDPPRARRHGGLATALALIGCAVLGTAAAYAYRSYSVHASVTQPPPVITADTSSTKIVPATVNDVQSAKAVQDRIANAGKEQIVSKQEEPVALKEIGTPTAPRVVQPAPVTPPPAAASPQASAGSGVISNEPKKVRTVTIRSDGTDMSGRPVGAPAQPSRATAPGATRTSPTPTGNEPLSLDPQGKDQPKDQTSEPPARIRTATAPAATASRTSSASSDGLMVQLSSHKSESEALASFRALQGRFPAELGGRQGVVRRADLGAKGVFYRAMVGPFASAQEASQFCASLKSAGASCMVPSH
jgi:SPOR domain